MDRLHALQKAHKQKHVKNLSAPPIINITPATPATPAEEPQITVFTSEPDEISPTAEFPTITVESPDNVNHSKGNSLADELQRAADGRNSSPSQTQGGSAQHTWNGSDGLLSPDSRSNPRRHSLPNLKQLGKEIKKIESTMASVPMGKLQSEVADAWITGYAFAELFFDLTMIVSILAD
ncbi:hypothetical protein BC937DRAFT_87933 [Endogone sp. FLAS-F59071]|nr:hypothetical protein BC937DRAFT_87933 [Endogone sp. FLAS-F59071]|eukprot:RUS12429.1 hypothetical protein BC937DRAFT_87933 [Endogone sp. FLAS-F59071]